MEINEETLNRLSKICRLTLSEEESKQLRKELESIFSHFSKISEVAGKQKIHYINPGVNELREDEPAERSGEEVEPILELFNRKEGRNLVAPKALE